MDIVNKRVFIYSKHVKKRTAKDVYKRQNMNYVDGVDMSTGSLGQGISAAVGMALANKVDGNDHRVYTLLGDGECEEGEVWEAAMAAAHYRLNNLCAIVDFNSLPVSYTHLHHDHDIDQSKQYRPFDKVV